MKPALGLLVFGWLCGWPVDAQTARANLTSAPVDRLLYREGEVRRWTAKFERWSVACDEITRLRERYCSLSTSIRDGNQQNVGRLAVSTNESGHPAALLRLPLGLSLHEGVSIEPSTDRAISGGSGSSRFRRTLDVVSCSTKECDVTWSLTPSDLKGLASTGLTIRYATVPEVTWPWTVTRREQRSVVGRIVPAGFADGVRASLAPNLSDPGTTLRPTIPSDDDENGG